MLDGSKQHDLIEQSINHHHHIHLTLHEAFLDNSVVAFVCSLPQPEFQFQTLALWPTCGVMHPG